MTDRVEMEQIVLQGENFAPLECSVQIDTIGKECIVGSKYLFYYRDSIPVPPLSMVDDLICISKCGINSIIMNSFINSKSSMKKLQFGVDKCHKIHVGKVKTVCPELFIDKWRSQKKEAPNIISASIEDIYAGSHNLQNVNE